MYFFNVATFPLPGSSITMTSTSSPLERSSSTWFLTKMPKVGCFSEGYILLNTATLRIYFSSYLQFK